MRSDHKVAPTATKHRYDCACDCQKCSDADSYGDGYGFSHCHNIANGCHYGEVVDVSAPSESGRKSHRPAAPPKRTRRRHGGQVVPFPADGSIDLGQFDPEVEYKVSVLYLDPIDQRCQPDFITRTIPIKTAKTAIEAAEIVLNKLGILWQGTTGEHGSCGAGPFGYLLCDRETNIHTLVWAHNELIARKLAGIPDHRIRYCTLVTVEKNPYIE